MNALNSGIPRRSSSDAKLKSAKGSLALLCCATLGACSTVESGLSAAIGMPLEPRIIEDAQLESFPTVDALIAEELGASRTVRYGSRGSGELLTPVVNLRRYCQLSGGSLILTQPESGPSLGRKGTLANTDGYQETYMADVSTAFGTFECEKEEKVIWGASIKNSGRNYADRESPITSTTISIRPYSAEDMQTQKRARESYAQERERQQAAEFRRIEESRRAAEQRRIRIEQEAVDLRNSIALGVDTHCGMVVQIREDLVEIQTVEGLHWFRTEQVYPPGTLECRFLNGVYVSPR